MKINLIGTLLALVFCNSMAYGQLEDASQGLPVIDEVIVDMEETGRSWQVETYASHNVWGKPACVAYTMSEDQNSYLEVVALYNETTQSFQEPEVHVVTTAADGSQNLPFLSIVAQTDGSNQKFELTPMFEVASLPTNKVLGRAKLEEREELVEAIRRRNLVFARYLDANDQEVKEIRFSLRGSNAAIQRQFEHCQLEFNELPQLESAEVVQP